MILEYGARISSGTHSQPIYSCTTLSLIIATTPTDFKCCWKKKKQEEKEEKKKKKEEEEKKKKIVWCQSFFQLCSQAVQCPTTNNQRRRFFGGFPHTSEKPLFSE